MKPNFRQAKYYELTSTFQCARFYRLIYNQKPHKNKLYQLFKTIHMLQDFSYKNFDQFCFLAQSYYDLPISFQNFREANNLFNDELTYESYKAFVVKVKHIEFTEQLLYDLVLVIEDFFVTENISRFEKHHTVKQGLTRTLNEEKETCLTDLSFEDVINNVRECFKMKHFDLFL